MKITAERREAGKFTFYTVRIASEFGTLELKDLKIIDGSKGRFVGFPSRKDDRDKWWPYMYADDSFQVELIKAMDAATPKPDTRTHAERKAPTLAEMDDDIPF